MAWEFGSKERYPKADINKLYFLDFEDIMGKTFGSAYPIITGGYEIENAADTARGLKELFEKRMDVFLRETEAYSVHPKIRNLVTTYSKKAVSFD